MTLVGGGGPGSTIPLVLTVLAEMPLDLAARRPLRHAE